SLIARLLRRPVLRTRQAGRRPRGAVRLVVGTATDGAQAVRVLRRGASLWTGRSGAADAAWFARGPGRRRGPSTAAQYADHRGGGQRDRAHAGDLRDGLELLADRFTKGRFSIRACCPTMSPVLLAPLLAVASLTTQKPQASLYDRLQVGASITTIILNANIRVDPANGTGTDIDAEDDLGLAAAKFEP